MALYTRYVENKGNSQQIGLIKWTNRSQNVEDNEETTLLGQDLDSWTLPWEHDNACFRLPAQFVRFLWHFILQHFWHILFFLILVVVGVVLLVSVSRGKFPLGLLILWSATAIGWAIFSRLSSEENA